MGRPPFLQKSFLPFPHFPLLHKQHLLIARERPQIFGNDRLEMIGKGADGIHGRNDHGALVMRFLHRIFNLHVHIVFEVLKTLAEFAQGVVDVVEQHSVGFAVQGAHVEAGTEQFLLEAQPGGVDDGPAHPDDEVRFGADRLAVLFDIDF